jgi:hypothetical protein
MFIHSKKLLQMKKYRLSALAIATAVTTMVSLGSCIQDKCISTSTYTMYEPVYILPEEMRKPIMTEAARALKNPGKIYYYQDFLFINELREGIHILDNRNPEQPQALAFLPIPGNVDMAVRNNVLYADNYVDLVAIDISNPTNPEYLSRTQNVFPRAFDFRQGFGFLVEYRETPTTRIEPCQAFGPWFFDDGVLFLDIQAESSFDRAVFSNASGSGSLAPSSVGIGGSMARFTIAGGQYLYTVDEFNLRVFNLAQASNPVAAGVTNIGWGIETIFPYGEQLFIGSNNGMFIYSISNPLQPVQLARFQHAQACDPVFVDGNRAYVTLRDGNDCQNFINQLDVIDISNLTNPRLLRTWPMHNPHGLSVFDGEIYICEKTQGLKVFDVTDINRIGDRLLEHISGFTAFDIIILPNKKIALVIGADGLYQFDISDPANLRQLSILPVNS